MCGISGILSPTPQQPNLLIQSLKAIKHRGPDDSRVMTMENGFSSLPFSNATTIKKYPLFEHPSKAMFGFNRLSIVDLSDNGMQPFFDEKSKTIFMLNGEIYNYKELRQTYLNTEHFFSDSDSEVAFRLYLKLGNKFIHLLRGMFAIVVYNDATQTLSAWRDPIGIKPFYYTNTNHAFAFSSEMKGLFATELISPSINPQGLAYSMYLGTCPSPLTIYNQIYSLKPGHQLSYQMSSGRVEEKSFWHLNYEPRTSKIHFDEFSEDIKSISNLYQAGEVAKGLMLSGGIDSGTMAYYMGQADQSMQCFNLFTSNHSTDESYFAKQNATNAGLGLTLFEIPSNPNPNEISRYLQSEEEPNSSPEPTLFLCDKVNQLGIKVLFNALGPDEIFGGYGYYKLINKYSNTKYFKYIPENILPARWQIKMSELKRFGWGAFPLVSRQFFQWKQIVAYLKTMGFTEPQHPIDYILEQIQAQMPMFNTLPHLKKASYIDIHYYIASHHAFRSDQPSMLNSIEMRFPFLDQLFVQKYFNQATIFQELHQHSKPQFRFYAKNILPQSVLEMPKKGFSMPTERWLSGLELHPNAIFTGTPDKQWYGAMLEYQNNYVKKQIDKQN